jgi:hypothetical protein
MGHMMVDRGCCRRDLAVLQPKHLLALLLPAVLAVSAFAAGAQTPSTGRLDELGCRDDWASASYKCERPPLAGRSFSSKQDALKRLQQLRAAPKPTAKPKAAAPSAKTGQTASPREGALSRPATPARTANWTQVANGEGAQYFIDTANLDRKGRMVTARTLTRYESLRSSSTVDKPYRSTVSVERYDCAARTSALTEMRYHAEGDGAGKVLETVAIPEDKLSYLAPMPGTVNEQLLNQVCSPKR